MRQTSDLKTCANPECTKPFRRFGEGKIFVFPVEDPEHWGLPCHAKQKVVWLCSRCAATIYVRLDRKQHRVQVVHLHREQQERRGSGPRSFAAHNK